MLVDWVTVVAQAINFLVLVYLLARFLYRPITQEVEQRQEMIERQAAQAREAEEAARESERHYQALRDELSAARRAKLDEAEEEAARWAAEFKAKARAEVEQLQQRWQDALARDQESFWQDFEAKLAREIYQTVVQAVADLSGGTDLDALIRGAFLERLASLSSEDKDRLQSLAGGESSQGAGGARGGSQPVEVLSAHELDAAYRERIVAAVRGLLGEDKEVSFVRRESLLAGVELRGPGWKTGWSVLGYIEKLRDRLDGHVQTRVAAGGGGK